MKLIQVSSIKMLIVFIMVGIGMSVLSSCEKDRADSVAVYEQKEQIGKKIKELSDLLANATYGYPNETKETMESKIAELKQFLEDIKTHQVAPENVGSATASLLNDISTFQTQFVAITAVYERVGNKIDDLKDLMANATFGLGKDMYPEESRTLIQSKITEVEEFLENITIEDIVSGNIDNQVTTLLGTVSTTQTQFVASKRTADVIKNGILYVGGKNGGYIDFGAHPEYSNFNGGPFTVEFWSKVDQFGNFDFLLSTFLDNFQPDDAKIFQGWGVNYNGGNMRMTYAVGVKDIYEPPVNNYNTTYAGQWVHLAFVWNPGKVADGSGSPKTFKMYVNGVLKKEEDWSKTALQASTANARMYGFTTGNFQGAVQTDRGTNGYMKNMNIWKSVKTQAQIESIKNNPTSVIGTEADLVCGWRFTQFALDNNNIMDITGRYSAKLVGNFNWTEQ